MYICLARKYGGSAIRIVVLGGAPSDDGDYWEDIVEVSIVIPDGVQPRWSTWAGWQGGVLDLASGSYRVRVSERGRDEAHADPGADIAMDVYLVQLWPASPRPDTIIKVTSLNAKYWHEVNGGGRFPPR